MMQHFDVDNIEILITNYPSTHGKGVDILFPAKGRSTQMLQLETKQVMFTVILQLVLDLK